MDRMENDMLIEESSLDRGISNEEDEIARIWSPYLYSLQRRAPKSRVLPVEYEVTDEDSIGLGLEYHGLLSKADAVDKLLYTKEGTYLVRKRTSGQLVISFRVSDDVKHFTIKRHGLSFLYGDKEFISVSELVDDSLITLFLEQHDISKHLTLARAKHQQRQSQFKRRNVLRYKNCEDQKRSCKFKTPRGSSKSLESSDAFVGMFRELSPDNNDEEQVQVFVEDEGEMRPKAMSQSDKIKRKRFHFRRKGQDCLSVTDNKHTPHEIVNLLSVYTRSHSEDPPPSTSLSKQKSASAGTLLESKGVVGQLLKSTLVLNTEEDLSHANYDEEPQPLSRTSSTSSYGKSHNFKSTTYKGPTWCDICQHFLWGLVQQGMRCQDCGINVHRLCFDDAHDIDCIPTKKLVKRVFGVDLTTVVLVDDDTVPKFLKLGLSELESRGLQTEGIYRVAGRTLHITELKEKADQNDLVNFSDVPDIHVISAVVKLFLRELPIPLITFDLYPDLIKIAQDIECSKLKQILMDSLPKAHYDTLQYVIRHLTKVADFCDVNKMKSSNLAVVFAPTIMRSPNVEDLLLKDIPLQKKIVEFMIDNYSLLFESQ